MMRSRLYISNEMSHMSKTIELVISLERIFIKHNQTYSTLNMPGVESFKLRNCI